MRQRGNRDRDSVGHKAGDVLGHKGSELGIPRDIREQRWGYHGTLGNRGGDTMIRKGAELGIT